MPGATPGRGQAKMKGWESFRWNWDKERGKKKQLAGQETFGDNVLGKNNRVLAFYGFPSSWWGVLFTSVFIFLCFFLQEAMEQGKKTAEN